MDPDSISPLSMARRHAFLFTPEFLLYLEANIHVYNAFEREALRVAGRGFKHYSARTIVEVLRHHSALREASSPAWKLNDHNTPYLARLFALRHPAHSQIFEFRVTKAANRGGHAATGHMQGLAA